MSGWMWKSLTIVGVLLVSAGAFASAGSAEAATGHDFVSRVAEAPAGTPLGEPGAVTVERSSGRVFVADPGTGVIDVFSSTGTFMAQFGEALEPSGIAIDEASGDVYVASGHAVLVFKPNGEGGYELLSEWAGTSTTAAEFGELRGVAVDNATGPSTGDVFVVDGSNNVVDIFQPKPVGPEDAQEGSFVGILRGGKLEEPNAIGVDASSGQVYVADSTEGVVDRFSASGSFEGKVTGAGSPEGSFRGSEDEEGNVSAIAVENGDLYVAEAERHVLSELNSAGEWIGWVTAADGAPLLEPDGVALAPSGDLYIADAAASQLDVFGPGVIVPDAQTKPASKIGKTSATFNGVVNGDGKAAKYHFEWGPTEAYGSVTPSASAGSGEEDIRVEVTGLRPGQVYHCRLVTENENGQNVGGDHEFAALPAVESLVTGPVVNLGPTEATLTGSLDPNGENANYEFEWGPTDGYGQTTPSVNVGSAKEMVTAKAELTGLTPNTTYHYRLTATNSFGVTLGEDRHFTTSGPPQIVTQLPTSVTHQSAMINAKIDPGDLETTYRFEYGETTSYGTEVPAAKLASGEAFDPVSATLAGLKIGTIYHYRLIAENSAGRITGPDQTFETVPPAVIEGISAIEVSASLATVTAQINPLGHDTTYYVQYGTEPCKPNPVACNDVPAAPGTDIGAGEAPIAVSQRISELKPATTYHFRAIAINSLGVSEGSEHEIVTPPTTVSFALPDSRAWELVTPPNKHGAPIEGLTREGGMILAAEDGDSIAYVADGSIVEEPNGNRSPEQQQDISTRTPEGWLTQDIATPNTRAQGVSVGSAPEYRFFTPDLSLAAVEPWGSTPLSEPPLAPEAKQKTIYIRNNATDTYLPLVTEANVPAGTVFGLKLNFLSATPDLSHVVLRSAVPLVPSPSGAGLYEWSAGELRFVSALPTGAPAREAELGYDGHVLAHAISSDGSRVIWTTKEENSGAGHLYLTDTATGETIQLDAAVGAREPNVGSAEFQTASADASRIFFSDKQRLTSDSTAEPAFPEKADLYECEIVEQAGKLSCNLKDLTVDHNQGEHAAVQGFLLGSGEEGTSVYFVAQGVLADNPNGNGEHAEAGKDNLYSLRELDESWTTTFIGQLSSEDSPEWEGNRGKSNTAFLTARASPNGRYLAFMSEASLTGYDNRDATSGQPDEEVFLYDSDEARLTCVSCNPTGARPRGVFDTVEAGEGLGLVVDRRKVWAEAGHEHWLAGNIPGWTAQSLTSALFQSRYLSDEGRLFFNSADALVPQVTVPTREEQVRGNKLSVGVENVYEYEPSGLGSCQSPTGGCISLISSGSSYAESAFLEATPSGNDVFFLTAAQLVPQDTDTAFDIYDARVCTEASPCLTSPVSAPPGCDTADTCHPSEPAQQAPLGPAGSATVTGQGSVTPAHQAHEPLATKTIHPKPLTRTEKLANAMRACKTLKNKRRRARCEAQAKKKYGASASTKRHDGASAKRTGVGARRARR
jgi:sugar lactone lactonase YvrE